MDKQLKKLPVGISNFSEIIEEDYIYVDKTADIFRMVDNGKIYFLSRPRRFGKSLLVDTLEELFTGNKKLFKGLYIYDKWDWDKTYPVVSLDLGPTEFETIDDLKNNLLDIVNGLARRFNVKLDSVSLNGKFLELFDLIYEMTGKPIVVLIDEYDTPINDHITDFDLLEKVKKVLNGFYKVLKTKDKIIKFIFITGVTKFSGTSVFSALNHPTDMTIDDRFSTICGYTQNEFEYYFKDYIKAYASSSGISYFQAVEKIADWYNGYSWDGKNFVFNPFTLLEFFGKNNFRNYWYATGTPSFLMKIIKYNNYVDFLFENMEPVSEKDLLDFDSFSKNVTALLFQTGYLTIKSIDDSGDVPLLYVDFPNKEVKLSFSDSLLKSFTNLSNKNIEKIKKDFKNAFINKDGDLLGKTIYNALAIAPHQIRVPNENYYHTAILIWLYNLGYDIVSQQSSPQGDSDCVLKMDDVIYVMEYKFSKISSLDYLIKNAFEQIHKNRYYDQYKGHEIYLVAIAFKGKEKVKCEIEKFE